MSGLGDINTKIDGWISALSNESSRETLTSKSYAKTVSNILKEVGLQHNQMNEADQEKLSELKRKVQDVESKATRFITNQDSLSSGSVLSSTISKVRDAVFGNSAKQVAEACHKIRANLRTKDEVKEEFSSAVLLFRGLEEANSSGSDNPPEIVGKYQTYAAGKEKSSQKTRLFEFEKEVKNYWQARSKLEHQVSELVEPQLGKLDEHLSRFNESFFALDPKDVKAIIVQAEKAFKTPNVVGTLQTLCSALRSQGASEGFTDQFATLLQNESALEYLKVESFFLTTNSIEASKKEKIFSLAEQVLDPKNKSTKEDLQSQLTSLLNKVYGKGSTEIKIFNSMAEDKAKLEFMKERIFPSDNSQQEDFSYKSTTKGFNKEFAENIARFQQELGLSLPHTIKNIGEFKSTLEERLQWVEAKSKIAQLEKEFSEKFGEFEKKAIEAEKAFKEAGGDGIDTVAKALRYLEDRKTNLREKTAELQQESGKILGKDQERIAALNAEILDLKMSIAGAIQAKTGDIFAINSKIEIIDQQIPEDSEEVKTLSSKAKALQEEVDLLNIVELAGGEEQLREQFDKIVQGIQEEASKNNGEFFSYFMNRLAIDYGVAFTDKAINQNKKELTEARQEVLSQAKSMVEDLIPSHASLEELSALLAIVNDTSKEELRQDLEKTRQELHVAETKKDDKSISELTAKIDQIELILEREEGEDGTSRAQLKGKLEEVTGELKFVQEEKAKNRKSISKLAANVKLIEAELEKELKADQPLEKAKTALKAAREENTAKENDTAKEKGEGISQLEERIKGLEEEVKKRTADILAKSEINVRLEEAKKPLDGAKEDGRKNDQRILELQAKIKRIELVLPRGSAVKSELLSLGRTEIYREFLQLTQEKIRSEIDLFLSTKKNFENGVDEGQVQYIRDCFYYLSSQDRDTLVEKHGDVLHKLDIETTKEQIDRIVSKFPKEGVVKTRFRPNMLKSITEKDALKMHERVKQIIEDKRIRDPEDFEAFCELHKTLGRVKKLTNIRWVFKVTPDQIESMESLNLGWVARGADAFWNWLESSVVNPKKQTLGDKISKLVEKVATSKPSPSSAVAEAQKSTISSRSRVRRILSQVLETMKGIVSSKPSPSIVALCPSGITLDCWERLCNSKSAKDAYMATFKPSPAQKDKLPDGIKDISPEEWEEACSSEASVQAYIRELKPSLDKYDGDTPKGLDSRKWKDACSSETAVNAYIAEFEPSPEKTKSCPALLITHKKQKIWEAACLSPKSKADYIAKFKPLKGKAEELPAGIKGITLEEWQEVCRSPKTKDAYIASCAPALDKAFDFPEDLGLAGITQEEWKAACRTPEARVVYITNLNPSPDQVGRLPRGIHKSITLEEWNQVCVSPKIKAAYIAKFQPLLGKVGSLPKGMKGVNLKEWKKACLDAAKK